MASDGPPGVLPGAALAPRAGGRGHTSETHSASFSSAIVNGFVDSTQDKFIQMLMILAGYINLIASVLQINIRLGSDHTMSSTITTDPMVQPIGPPPIRPYTQMGLTLITRHSSGFMANLRDRFQLVVNQLGARPGVLVIDMRLGDVHHCNSTVRLHPATLDGELPSPSSFSGPTNDENDDDNGHGGGDGGFPGHGCTTGTKDPRPHSTALHRLGSTVDTASTAGVSSVNNEPSYLPLGPEESEVEPEFMSAPPGAIAAFFSRFNGATNPPAIEDDHEIELMDTNEMELSDEFEDDIEFAEADEYDADDLVQDHE